MKQNLVTRQIGLAALAALVLMAVACSKKTPPPPPVPDIPVIELISQDVPIKEDFIGQTYGTNDIPIRARVEGWITGMYFTEGSIVKKGQLLYTIDPEPFNAQVAAAEGELSEAQTMLVKAESDLARYRPLAEINAVAKSDLDAAVGNYGAAKGKVDAAKAMLDYAKIELSYTRITSPITGRIGKTEAKTGDFVGRYPNPVVLNTVSLTDTILVQFFIPEAKYLKLMKDRIGKTEEERDKTQSQRTTGYQLLLADGTIHNSLGKLDFAERQVDPKTGSLMFQASFPNKEGIIKPGQFARVRVEIGLVKDAVAVPLRCIKEIQGIHQVFVVSDSNTVDIRTVKVGSLAGNFRIIDEGLKPGEKIVYEGLQRLKQGSKLNPAITEVTYSF